MAASDVEHDPRPGQPGTATDGASLTDDADDEVEQGAMTLVEHLEELRKRILIALAAIVVFSVVGFIFWQPILQFLLTPLPNISTALTHNPGQKLVQNQIGEAFVISLKLAIAVGIALGSPVVLYQLWAFISPGLTQRERKYAAPFTLLGAGLFVVGLAVGFVVLRFPIAWLINFGSKDYLLLLDANAYFTFVAYFMLAFGIVFELPLVLTFLSMVGIVNSRMLRAKRAYILFGLWFLACVITPGADPYSPVIMGVALTLLFELSIVLMRIMKH
jgi:sec-independent protein translocase protein TatC